jgi:outer membrane protein assembly factor BamB
MESPETGITVDFVPGQQMDDSEEIDMSTTKNVKWVAKLGSQAYGNTTIADGRVYVGTNNESPRDPKHKGDRGNVFCLDEETGKLLWQLVVPKLGAGKVSDWEYLGICSSPAIDGERAYVVTNRCEVVCLDVKGLSDGNDGPYEDEGQYMAGQDNPPVEVGELDADIIWVYDMRDELGVFPHNIASSSVLPVDGKIYVTTSNGQDWSHLNIPNPLAPAFICLDQETGELLGEEVSQISERLYHCNWSSPAYGEVNGKGIVLFGAGDGFLYGFDPVPVKDEDDFDILKEIFRYDVIPPHYKVKDGKQIRYPASEGPSEIIGTPVFYKDKVYASIGQDPEHGSGVGNLACIDASGSGNITESGKVWTYEKIGRSISTASIADDIVYLAEFDGFIHALDANTGEELWVHDTKSHIWSSTLYVDGKVLCANEDGILTVLKASKEKEVLAEVEFDAPIYSTPVVANGVLYVASQTHLYAIGDTAK